MANFSLTIVADHLAFQNFWQPLLDLLIVAKISDRQLEHHMMERSWDSTTNKIQTDDWDSFVIDFNWSYLVNSVYYSEIILHFLSTLEIIISWIIPQNRIICKNISSFCKYLIPFFRPKQHMGHLVLAEITLLSFFDQVWMDTFSLHNFLFKIWWISKLHFICLFFILEYISFISKKPQICWLIIWWMI